MHIGDTRFVSRALAVVLFWLVAAGIAMAQDENRPLIRVPWAGNAGFAFIEPDGTPHSFFIDLARMIADEADFDIELVEYPSVPDATQSVRDGETDMLAGALRRAFDENTVVFAGPVAETQFILFVRKDAPRDLTFNSFGGGRIGVLRNSVTSRIPPPEGSTMVEYDDQVTAFAKLLSGEVEGVLAISPLGLRTLSTTGLDALIRPSLPPVRESRHFVALRREHAELLPRLEAAIARLEDSGALNDLRSKWFMVPPVPPPSVLNVGVSNFPPYYVIKEDGTFSGFGVEIIRELAERADIELRFEPISLESWSKGPRVGAFDLIPARSVTEAEAELLQFTAPIQTITYSAFVRAGDADKPLSREDGRIGILSSSPLRSDITQALGVELVPIKGIEEGVAGLHEGSIDALIFPRSAFETFVSAEGESDHFARLAEPEFRNDLAIALRPGLGDLKQRLNVVIQGFLGSARYREIASRWFDEPPFWTPERIRLAGFVAAGALLAAVVIVFLLILAGRRRALDHAERMEDLSNQLGAILNTAQSGILGFNRSEEIAIANSGAREMIGESDGAAPLRWPNELSFVDPVDFHPLDASRHPINRALAGSHLRGELALMKQGELDKAYRYVRVSSSPLVSAKPRDISTVVILDDVTDEERNRQTVERAARLDALGQMTGGIAHDFNNILATIEFAASFAVKQSTGKPRDYLATIVNTVRRGSELTHRLLAFAKQVPGQEKTARAGDIIAEFRNLADLTGERSVRIEYAIQDEDLMVFCDTSQLENALLNLVINSRDAILSASKGGRIVVGVRGLSELPGQSDQIPNDVPGPSSTHTYRYVEFSVTDDGPGMTEEVKRRATDPFFTTKGSSAGTGLGLSMVYGFIQRSGGDMRLYSELGHGTTVRIFLPRGTEAGQREGLQDQPVLESGTGQRILVVEDEPVLLDLVAQVIESLNYDVVKANSGEEALELVKQGERIDLLLTDVVMSGGIGGFQLAREIRNLFPGLPVVYMSGFTGISTTEMGDVVGPILQKPCPPSDLAQVLQSQLKGG